MLGSGGLQFGGTRNGKHWLWMEDRHDPCDHPGDDGRNGKACCIVSAGKGGTGLGRLLHNADRPGQITEAIF